MNSPELLRRLSEAGVEFVRVGGLAATVHGSAYVTHDTDICVPFSRENVERILRAVAPLNPRQRMHPSRSPLTSNAANYEGLKNLYLVTTEGQLDLLGHVLAVGNYAACLAESSPVSLGAFSIQVLNPAPLVRRKRALARPHDLHVAAELSALHRLG